MSRERPELWNQGNALCMYLLFACFFQTTLFFRRAKLRHILEWSSLYRVTLLLSKINDDSDLDAEAAILYGKVSKSNVDGQFPLKGSELYLSYWVVESTFPE